MQTEPVDPRKLVGLARESEQCGNTAMSLGLYEQAIGCLGDEKDLALLADALRWKGTLHREQGDTETAYRCYKQSLTYAVRCGSVSCKAHCYNCLAIVAQRRGNLNECERLYKHAADLASKAGDIILLGIIEHNRGVLMNMRGKLTAAEVRYASSLNAFETVGDDQAVSSVLNNLGILYTKLGHYQRAMETLERGLEIARARQDSVIESILRLNLAEAWVAVGKLDQAEEACTQSLVGGWARVPHRGNLPLGRGGEGCEQCVYLGGLVSRIEALKGLSRLPPCPPGLRRVSERAGSRPKFAEHLRLEKLVFQYLGLANPDSKSGNARVESAPLAFDSGSALQSPCHRHLIATGAC